jgi:hypothetical protein
MNYDKYLKYKEKYFELKHSGGKPKKRNTKRNTKLSKDFWNQLGDNSFIDKSNEFNSARIVTSLGYIYDIVYDNNNSKSYMINNNNNYRVDNFKRNKEWYVIRHYDEFVEFMTNNGFTYNKNKKKFGLTNTSNTSNTNTSNTSNTSNTNTSNTSNTNTSNTQYYIYLLTVTEKGRTKQHEWEFCINAVINAIDEDNARIIANKNKNELYYDDYNDKDNNFWSNKDYVSCEKIGQSYINKNKLISNTCTNA